MRKIHPTPNLFFSLSLLLILLAWPVGAANNKTDQVRPAAKTAGSHAKAREAESERKGKKALPLSRSEAKAAANKASKAKQPALASKAQPVKSAKGKSTSGKACASCVSPSAGAKPTAAKTTTAKTNGPRSAVLVQATPKKSSLSTAAAPSKTATGKPTQLSSRLVPASYTADADDESRGKFGKNNVKPKRHEEEPGDAPPAVEPMPRTREAVTGTPDAVRPSNRVPFPKKERDDDKEAEKDDQKRNQRQREVTEKETGPLYELAYPDQIEVTEYGSTSSTIQNLLKLPTMRPLTPFGAVVTRSSSTPGKRSDLAIPQQRILEIQYQLASRGFYNSEPNGVYDELTVQAMWEFQKNYGLPATGYPTAHALKRLGLAN